MYQVIINFFQKGISCPSLGKKASRTSFFGKVRGGSWCWCPSLMFKFTLGRILSCQPMKYRLRFQTYKLLSRSLRKKRKISYNVRLRQFCLKVIGYHRMEVTERFHSYQLWCHLWTEKIESQQLNSLLYFSFKPAQSNPTTDTRKIRISVSCEFDSWSREPPNGCF